MEISNLLKSLLLILFTLIQLTNKVSGSQSEAYATLLYGDEFLLGVRVLGKSIKDTGSSRDMVVLVSDGVSDFAKKLLQADGWIIEKISLLANPNQIRPARFWGVYTKLKIFNMVKYKKVVYLDADTIVLKNIDDLFNCGKFCGNLKHSERMNSGVMVVEPSEAVFNDMISKVSTLHSYTGGDQGFLNSYFPGFANAKLFEPNLPADVRKSRPVPEMERLSTLYNADVGLYALANKWMVDEKELRVIHYTLGPLKPWDWWTGWVLNPVDIWQKVRVNLEDSLPGTGGGRNPNEDLMFKFILLLPIVTLLCCYYRSFLQLRTDLFGSLCRSLCNPIRHLYYKLRATSGLPYSSVGVPSSSILNSSQQISSVFQSKVPAYLGGISVVVCFIIGLTSLGIAVSVVPRQVMPWTGLLLVYEWTFTLFLIVFGGYLHLLYTWGKSTTPQADYNFSPLEAFDHDSGKGHQKQASACDVASWYYGLGMALLAFGAPLLPFMLGITALFVRLGLMVVGGVVLAIFTTYASEHLAIKAFLRGREDRDTPRTRSICLIC
ncbi:Inositol phosphorylceramide glucuronosyltransferase 1 [Ranunculus cassubicifolius]